MLYCLSRKIRNQFVFFLCTNVFVFSSNAAIDYDNPSVDELLSMSLEELLNVQVSVASQFTESPLQIGSTTTVITENQWQSLGARRLKDAFGNLPSTIVLPNWFGAEPIYIRGYASGNNTNGVATIIDGISVNSLEGGTQFTQQNINLGILDRIEMIRGPGSALYGESAFHGAVALHTFQSDQDVSKFATDYSSNQFYDASLKHSQAIGTKWRIHVAGALSGQADQNQKYEYIDQTLNTTAESERDLHYNTKTAVVTLKSKPINKVSYLGSILYDRNQYNDFYSAGTSSSVASSDTGGVDSHFLMSQIGGKYQFNENKDGNLKFYFIKKHRIFDRSFKPGTATFVGIGELVGRGGETTYGTSLTLRQKELMDNTQLSLELSAKRSKMGAYSVKQTDESGAEFNAFPLGFSDFVRDTYSVALDAATRFYQNKFILRYGVRFDDYSDFGSHISPRLGVIFQPSNDSAIKLLYGHAFRAPNAGEVKGFATVITSSDLKPETIDTFELVYAINTKHTLQEYVLFRSFWDDAITNIGGNKNTGENSAYGAEVSCSYLKDEWKLPFSASYVRSKNKVDKQNFVAFPQWIINAGISYQFISQQVEIAFNNRIHLKTKEGQIVGSEGSFSAPDNLKDYWRADIHISKQWNKKAILFLDVRNLFNRENFIPSVQVGPSTGGLPDESISLQAGLRYQL